MTRKISDFTQKQIVEKHQKLKGIRELRFVFHFSYRQIGDALGVSRQRVHQLLEPFERKRIPIRKVAARPKPSKAKKFIDSFWSKVDVRGPDECWNWQGLKDPNGYGRLTYRGRSDYPHRIMYRIKTGEEIPEGMVVMHTCDHPSCLNPSHLLLGTQLDNMRDRDNKGRHRAPEVIRELARKRDIELADFIAKYFGGKPVTIAQLVEATGGSQQGMYDKVRRMERRGLIHYERNSRGGRTPGLIYTRSTTP